MGPISIHDSGECQEDIGMSPSTANFQRAGGVVHQYIQCLFIHYDLKETKCPGDSESTESLHTCILLKIALTLNCLSRWCASWQSLMTKCSWESGTRELACFSRLHTSWNGKREAQHSQERVSQHFNTPRWAHHPVLQQTIQVSWSRGTYRVSPRTGMKNTGSDTWLLCHLLFSVIVVWVSLLTGFASAILTFIIWI